MEFCNDPFKLNVLAITLAKELSDGKNSSDMKIISIFLRTVAQNIDLISCNSTNKNNPDKNYK